MASPSELPPIPRRRDTDHDPDAVAARLRYAEDRAGRALLHLAGRPQAPGHTRGNIENLVGFAQVPVGLAGPLRFEGGRGPIEVVVPMATTEGAMVASYSRGMKAIGGGDAKARVISSTLSQHPVLVYASALDAIDAARIALEERERFEALTAEITSHGRLVGLEPEPVGRRLVLRLLFETGDAIGINMAAHASERISARLAERTDPLERFVHGEDVEKRANARALVEGRGRNTIAEVVIPRAWLAETLRVAPADLVAIHRTYTLGFARLGTQNQLVQAANGLAAVFLACGQDVAYVTESSTGTLDFRETTGGDLYASAHLPNLLIGTVGGGTALGTASECLDLLGVRGDGGAEPFAEILAATVLAGDLSLLASFCTHEFVGAHERLGRNRPPAGGGT
ncbi:MAG TPA: 3-hydroxy-3-methylglutaryl-CoA reductase [Planctomycetes bacterium]|nr:3-hydroxy-3-methylglutaryl-CoA reductase [Planctomycetota bacterium]